MFRCFFLLFLAALGLAPTMASAGDTASVFFLFNKSGLTDISRARIDKLIYNGDIDDNAPVQIIGYADYVGGEAYNLDLSRHRAAAVKAYLLESGFKAKNITVIIGKGKIDRQGMAGNTGFAPDRRVDIVRGAPVAAEQPAAQTTTPRTFSEVTSVDGLKVNATIKLDKIVFYPGRHIVREDSKPALVHLYEVMVANPRLKIRVEGHVCCIKKGAPDALDEDTGGLVLSTNRAKEIQEWLVSKGINRNRVTSIGFGKQVPIVQDEVTEEEADLNRRVEVRILEK